ncbi:hypothetical protein [Thiolapillus sp.]|uniref:hypothetical protein n=3 Tax=Thiolapillus sp. TaxID=2017437 RepID=UPI0025FD0C12|nr:hypothetical protein [Thiolapillus sp.]
MRTTGKQCGLAATGDYQPSLRSPWLAAMDDEFNVYFQKGELPEGITVKITVEEDPQVLDIGKDILIEHQCTYPSAVSHTTQQNPGL